jgi:catalase
MNEEGKEHYVKYLWIPKAGEGEVHGMHAEQQIEVLQEQQ